MQVNKSHRADKANISSRFKRIMKRARAYGVNIANAMNNRAMRRSPDKVLAERQALIGGMTNWQHNQAGRKCKGKWDTLSMQQLEYYAALPHYKRSA